MDCSHIAGNICAARKGLVLSQEELAERADVPLAVVRAAERGEDVGASWLHCIAVALLVDLDELLSTPGAAIQFEEAEND